MKNYHCLTSIMLQLLLIILQQLGFLKDRLHRKGPWVIKVNLVCLQYSPMIDQLWVNLFRSAIILDQTVCTNNSVWVHVKIYKFSPFLIL